MRKWVRTSAKTALLTAGFVALGAGVSFADSAPVTSGNGSIGGGNQIVGNADVPVNVSGNAIALGGSTANATSKDTGARVIDDNGDDGPITSGNGSVLGGNQGVLDLDVPVNASGNAVAGVLSSAAATSEDSGAWVLESGRSGHSAPVTSGNGSAGGGNQIVGHGDVPVNFSGNAIAAGLSAAHAASKDTGAFVVHDRAGQDEGPITSGNGSVLGGNQGVL
ncbi:hypothetical protein O4U47_24705, partial [Nocardiopsis sp. LSu2-4]|nr:hypothetical protein [Nocardiopsis suaedae]